MKPEQLANGMTVFVHHPSSPMHDHVCEATVSNLIPSRQTCSLMVTTGFLTPVQLDGITTQALYECREDARKALAALSLQGLAVGGSK